MNSHCMVPPCMLFLLTVFTYISSSHRLGQEEHEQPLHDFSIHTFVYTVFTLFCPHTDLGMKSMKPIPEDHVRQSMDIPSGKVKQYYIR